jgi:dimethylamine monooxygenase subunit A
MLSALEDLFPEEDYRFHLTLRRGDLAAFFGFPAAGVLRERRGWLESDRDRYVAFLPRAAPLLAELEGMAAAWVSEGGAPAEPRSDGEARLAGLAGRLEPDLLLLTRETNDTFTLAAGAVCFPSWWSLGEKIGGSLDAIHGPVPGLNPALGGTINQFLGKLKPGTSYLRANWGLAATAELNLHPALKRPRLPEVLDPAQVWVRVEDQLVAALPVSRGILFALRIRTFPLQVMLETPRLRSGFHRSLATMPAELAAYKGILGLMPALLAACR